MNIGGPSLDLNRGMRDPHTHAFSVFDCVRERVLRSPTNREIEKEREKGAHDHVGTTTNIVGAVEQNKMYKI